MDRRLFDDDDPLAGTGSMPSLEADIFSGQLPSPPWPDLDLDDDGHELSGAPAANATFTGEGSGGSGSHRKLSHNAYERDRRRQLNGLYSSLRSLLPDVDHTEKLSIPTTVSRVVRYIPELQKQVENLEKKKKDLSTTMNSSCKTGVVGTSQTMSESTAPIVSATCVSEMEIMVQVSLLSNVAGTTFPLSKCIKILENEGLHLISSSSSSFGNRTFYSLHLQRNQAMLKEDWPECCDRLEKVIRNEAELCLP